MLQLRSLLAAAVLVGLGSAHTVITYPGWRGNNLHANGSLPENCPQCIGIDTLDNGTISFPWGMQWMYPCGGMPQTTNRSYWPVSGGALSVQPGWFPGHSKALIYVNIGIQENGSAAPPNMSHPVVPPFEVTGPSNQQYPGQFCLPQIGMPANVSLQPGMNITLQVVEAAQHGAALYSCVDLTLVEDGSPLVQTVGPDNCYNSSNIGFQLLFTTASLTSGAFSSIQAPSLAALVTTVLLSVVASLL
ncbi:hypothetical protein BAUCODRAFT_36220 [Baudoinia panamericana UAMH 10762]|uniref:Copper acquisition factor BIM1-like domain-containing protein n=1 Tax=Baudoinia panamericana (strain UAMH 10762) TaxID=717646 RepID=M2MQJ9_BAUPA|nr:uncharacterized protein BAUCODRAFT_36220 [Baudoinia panamericana UAMH 10762]EMC93768.1 hypothetical protein BAUCODRAFT_36220 [Baudoinia panamericana UAMH 10762]